MSDWIKVGTIDQFKGKVMVYRSSIKPVAIFRLSDGYFAIEDVCSHEEASLSEGEIEDSKVECPLHGAIFDIKTGKNLALPAVLPVKSYPVKVENGDILLEI
jgi:3-phenylpropionate/trans-cinnamate dioxygenase ferredoxin component